MSAKFIPIVISALFSIASAAVTPTGPAPGAVFNEGSDCLITWDADKTGTWTDLKIQLMNGDNFNMIPLATVVDGVDGTKSPGTFTWTCPDVGLNAPIFFYEFTNGGVETGEGNVFWTGRWTIADAQGNSVAAPNTSEDGNGNSYNWGVTTLASSTSGNSTTSASASTSSSASQESSSSASVSETSSDSSRSEASTSSESSSSATSSSSSSSSASSSTAQSQASNDSAAGTTHAGLFGCVVAAVAALLI